MKAGKSTGQPKKLPTDQEAKFKQRMLAGPTQADGVCTRRGVDGQRILDREFGVKYSLDGVYELMHRLGRHDLSNRVYKDYDEIFDAIKAAWLKLTPERLASITNTTWISRTI